MRRGDRDNKEGQENIREQSALQSLCQYMDDPETCKAHYL